MSLSLRHARGLCYIVVRILPRRETNDASRFRDRSLLTKYLRTTFVIKIYKSILTYYELRPYARISSIRREGGVASDPTVCVLETNTRAAKLHVQLHNILLWRIKSTFRFRRYTTITWFVTAFYSNCIGIFDLRVICFLIWFPKNLYKKRHASIHRVNSFESFVFGRLHYFV